VGTAWGALFWRPSEIVLQLLTRSDVVDSFTLIPRPRLSACTAILGCCGLPVPSDPTGRPAPGKISHRTRSDANWGAMISPAEHSHGRGRANSS
jgi:hypothetical protein